jgi:hypothetical protein
VARSWYRSAAASAHRSRLAAIGKFTVPTLIIASGRSSELSEQRELAGRLPDGRIEVVDQAAHAVFIRCAWDSIHPSVTAV